MTTPLPTPPNTASPLDFRAKADAFMAALPVFQTELDALAGTMQSIGRNLLINAQFNIFQRGFISTADDAYGADRWYSLTQTGAIAVSRLSDPENGYINALRMTQSQASAQRFGTAQIIEGINCKSCRGSSVTLQARMRISTSTTLRYAIIAWTGAEDVVASDFVNSWTNGTFTAGQFFNSTTLTILATGSKVMAANTWGSITPLSVAAGTSFTNLAVMFWTDSAQAQNVTLDIDMAQLEPGANATSFERRLYSHEYLLCQRYCYTWGGDDTHTIISPGFISSGTFYGWHPISVPLRTASITFSTTGTWGCSNISGSANQVATSGPTYQAGILGSGLNSRDVRFNIGCSGLPDNTNAFGGAYNSAVNMVVSAEL